MFEREVQLAGHPLRLRADRTAFRPDRRTLLVADLHLGKPAAFAAAGIPVPAGTTQADLHRLADAIDQTGARCLVILGDLLHARAGRDQSMLELVARWRAARPALHITLVRGNHDRSAGDPPADWSIECVDEGLEDDGLIYRHEPEESDRGYVLCGHVHPVLVLRGSGQLRERAPAFWVGPRVGVLPAFGRFTGGASVQPRAGDRLFATDGQSLLELALPAPLPPPPSPAATSPPSPAQPRTILPTTTRANAPRARREAR
jgi:DNA ligase-associated metallophosphoesterase